MNEYMFRILNQIDHQKTWPEGRHVEFVKKCEIYIKKLQDDGALIAAQPLRKSGIVLSGTPGKWAEIDLGNTGEVQVGYYHIRARNLSEAVNLAKGNPEFEYSSTARIEIRPITESEEETGFVYPK